MRCTTKSPFYSYKCVICGKTYKDIEAAHDHVYDRHLDHDEIVKMGREAVNDWVCRHIKAEATKFEL